MVGDVIQRSSPVLFLKAAKFIVSSSYSSKRARLVAPVYACDRIIHKSFQRFIKFTNLLCYGWYMPIVWEITKMKRQIIADFRLHIHSH